MPEGLLVMRNFKNILFKLIVPTSLVMAFSQTVAQAEEVDLVAHGGGHHGGGHHGGGHHGGHHGGGHHGGHHGGGHHGGGHHGNHTGNQQGNHQGNQNHNHHHHGDWNGHHGNWNGRHWNGNAWEGGGIDVNGGYYDPAIYQAPATEVIPATQPVNYYYTQPATNGNTQQSNQGSSSTQSGSVRQQ